MIEREAPVLLVVSGPSGAGKSTLVDRYVESNRSRTALIVSATTRDKRPSEVDGQDYIFLERGEFETMRDADRFLEWAEVHGNFYGTPQEQVEKALDGGQDVILEIDVQGGLQVKRKLPHAVLCFLTPPGRDDLETRLKGRAEDSQEVIQKRLVNALKEYEALTDYDYVVVNDELDLAQRDLEAIVRAERCSLRAREVDSLIRDYTCGDDS